MLYLKAPPGSPGSSSGSCRSWCRCWWRGPSIILPSTHPRTWYLRPMSWVDQW